MTHRWGERVVVSPNKTERQCLRCGIVKATRNECEGGRPLFWTEFWRGLDRIEGDGTPACAPVGDDVTP